VLPLKTTFIAHLKRERPVFSNFFEGFWQYFSVLMKKPSPFIAHLKRELGVFSNFLVAVIAMALALALVVPSTLLMLVVIGRNDRFWHFRSVQKMYKILTCCLQSVYIFCTDIFCYKWPKLTSNFETFCYRFWGFYRVFCSKNEQSSKLGLFKKWTKESETLIPVWLGNFSNTFLGCFTHFVTDFETLCYSWFCSLPRGWGALLQKNRDGDVLGEKTRG